MTGRPTDEAGESFYHLYRNCYLNRTQKFNDYSPHQMRLFRYWAVYLMKCWLVSPEFRTTKDVRKIVRSIREHLPDALTTYPIYIEGTIARLWTDFGMGTFRRSNKTSRLKNQWDSIAGLCSVFDVDMKGVVEQLVRDHPEIGDPQNLLNKSQMMVVEEYDIPPRVVKAIFHELTDSGEYQIKVMRDSETKKPIKALVCRMSREGTS